MSPFEQNLIELNKLQIPKLINLYELLFMRVQAPAKAMTKQKVTMEADHVPIEIAEIDEIKEEVDYQVSVIKHDESMWSD